MVKGDEAMSTPAGLCWPLAMLSTAFNLRAKGLSEGRQGPSAIAGAGTKRCFGLLLLQP